MVLDLGCKTGSSFNFCGQQIISVDNRRNFLVKAPGHKILADIRFPVVKPKSVNFVILSHVLEHLEFKVEIGNVIVEAVEAAKYKVFIRGPWFDSDLYLKSLGFNLFWSTWSGHKTHLTSLMLDDILKENNIGSYKIRGIEPKILNSRSHRIHPVGYEAGGNYKEGEHPPKNFVNFTEDVWEQIYCEIDVGEIK